MGPPRGPPGYEAVVCGGEGGRYGEDVHNKGRVTGQGLGDGIFLP